MKKLGSEVWGAPSDSVIEQFFDFSEEFSDLRVLNNYSDFNLEGKLSSADKAELVFHKIQNAIKSGSGFSMVRMGDGEGSCLFNYSKYPDLKKYVIERISYMHFGDGDVILKYEDVFRNYLMDSVLSADIIGVPELETVKRRFHDYNEKTDVRAVVGNRQSIIYVAEKISFNQISASAWINRNLLPFYRKIFEKQKNVGVISSHPGLGSLMMKEFKIENVVAHSLPTQAVFVKTSDRKNSFHYPDRFFEIVNQINPIVPGMPYLVAGGILAKYYCHIIKSRGGVAIDVGSVPEIWLGIPNRGLSEDFINRWKLV